MKFSDVGLLNRVPLGTPTEYIIHRNMRQICQGRTVIVIAHRMKLSEDIWKQFRGSSFATLGLPGGDIVDAGLADLAAGRTSPESLTVSLAAPRLRREGLPVGTVQENAEDRLYDLLEQTSGDLAHARYNAYLRQVASFAGACRLARYARKLPAEQVDAPIAQRHQGMRFD